MAQNSTFLLTAPHKSYLSAVHPWYYDPNPRLWNPMSDFWFSLVGPVVAYWLLSGFFEILDRGDWEWLQKYKIHESGEVTSRNKVTRRQVVVAVILQQVFQVMLGYLWMDPTVNTGGPLSMHVPRMEAIAPTILCSLKALLGHRLAAFFWRHKAQDLVYYVYWWAIPFAQVLAGW
jgi:sphinganine C4-monooxygenase